MKTQTIKHKRSIQHVPWTLDDCILYMRGQADRIMKEKFPNIVSDWRHDHKAKAYYEACIEPLLLRKLTEIKMPEAPQKIDFKISEGA